MSNPTTKSPRKPPKTKSTGKYFSMATTMAVIIVVGTFSGRWLDQYFQPLNFPLFTLTFALVAVFAAMWYFIHDVLKK